MYTYICVYSLPSISISNCMVHSAFFHRFIALSYGSMIPMQIIKLLYEYMPYAHASTLFIKSKSS